MKSIPWGALMGVSGDREPIVIPRQEDDRFGEGARSVWAAVPIVTRSRAVPV